MSLQALLKNNLFFINLKASTKQDVFNELAQQLLVNNKISNLDQFIKDINAREDSSTTFMENLVAIPHCKSNAVLEPTIVLGISQSKISNNLQNPSFAQIFFMLAMPNNAENTHLEVISSLAQHLIDEQFCQSLLQLTNKDDFIKLLNSGVNMTDASLKASINNNNDNNKGYDIVAITACPTGVAHTYIASEKLMEYAKQNNLKIKVQTNGSIGIRNELTKDDIQNAKAVIIASDLELDLSQFEGKYLIKVPVAEAVHKTADLVNKALNNTNIYQGLSSKVGQLNQSFSDDASNATKESSIKSIFGAYKHLLNGVSFMIPFVVAGGALIAGAIAFSGIQAGSGVVITNPILKHMEELGALAFSLMVPILAGYTGYSIAGRAGLAPAMIGGMLANTMKSGFLGGIVIGMAVGYFVKWLVSLKLPKAIDTIMPILIIPVLGTIWAGVIMYFIGSYISSVMILMTEGLKAMQGGSAVLLAMLLGLMISFDMGGPVNKVAMLFGISMISAGVPTIMGPIATAICIPPLGMALATYLAPKKYSTEERVAGKASFMMGLIGITEGAIPFAAADPLRVIPSIMISSALGAGIAGYFKVANYAPHGGPIVLPVISGKLYYLLAIAIGSIICAILVNVLKKNKA